MRIRRARLIVEELGTRTLPSVTVVLPPVTLGTVAVSSTSHPLHGTASGTYVGSSTNIDAGPSWTLSATADLGSLGTFKVTGWVEAVGLVNQGRATGELILSNSQGTITLALHGGMQKGLSPLPPELVYAISGSTGAYQHMAGYGVVGITHHPAPTAFGLPPRGFLTLAFY